MLFRSAEDYSGKSISNNTVNFSSTDASKNIFTLTYKVSGAGSDVATDLIFSIDNPSVIVLKGGTYSKVTGITAARFEILSDGETVIRAKTTEGNKSKDYSIRVNVPLESFVIKDNLVPVLRGSKVDLSDSDKYLDYYPTNTTEREVS